MAKEMEKEEEGLPVSEAHIAVHWRSLAGGRVLSTPSKVYWAGKCKRSKYL